MAVAVKNRDTTETGLFDRLPVQVLVGVLYVLGSLGILFPLLSSLWWSFLPFDRSQVVAWALLVVGGVLVAAGLVYLGSVLLGPNPPKGLKAGIFLGVAGVFLAALIADWVGLWVESWLTSNPFLGSMTWAFGVGVTIGVGVLLLALLVRFFLDPRAEGWLAAIEDQGWFTAAAYKGSQGMRVRRGTMLGLLLLAGSGIWTLDRSLSGDNQSWQFPLPFTGRAVVTRDSAGDVPELRQQLDQQAAVGVESPAVTLDRFQLQAYNSQAQAKYVKITDAGLDLYKDEQTVASERRDLFDQARQESPELFENARTFERGSVVAKSEVDAERKQRLEKRQKLQEKGLDEVLAQSQVVPPTDVPIEPASAEVQYTSLTLLPQLRFTLPLLLGALSLWLAWRVVNMPLFADFLVATEAELNKVSWTTRKRLVQDTIVVLVTVVLLCIFLFLADTVWSQLLTGIGVLQPPPRDTTQQAQEQPW